MHYTMDPAVTLLIPLTGSRTGALASLLNNGHTVMRFIYVLYYRAMDLRIRSLRRLLHFDQVFICCYSIDKTKFVAILLVQPFFIWFFKQIVRMVLHLMRFVVIRSLK